MAKELFEIMGEFTAEFQRYLRKEMAKDIDIKVLSERDIAILEAIHAAGSLQFRDVAEAMRSMNGRGASTSAISQAVSTLAKKGFLKKEIDANDQRQPRISLASGGRKIVVRLMRIQRASVALVESCLRTSRNERAMLLKVFNRGLANFRAETNK